MDCSPPGSSIHGIFQARILKSGDRKGAEGSLGKAELLAAAFDAAPNYAANQVKYVRESEMTNAHDLLGKTAMEAVEYVLRDKAPELRKLWKDVCDHADRNNLQKGG